MIYDIDSKSIHTLMQNSYMVSLFEAHMKEENIGLFNKIKETINKIKLHHNCIKPVLHVVRNDKSVLCDYYKKLCKDNPNEHLLLIEVQWDKGKNAGMQAFNQMLDIAHLSVCLFDGTNKLENIYMSIVDPFKTINYVLYTGADK